MNKKLQKEVFQKMDIMINAIKLALLHNNKSQIKPAIKAGEDIIAMLTEITKDGIKPVE